MKPANNDKNDQQQESSTESCNSFIKGLETPIEKGETENKAQKRKQEIQNRQRNQPTKMEDSMNQRTARQ